MENKTKVGIVTDSATIDSGYAKIAREVFRRLSLAESLDIAQLGWWYKKTHNTVPFPIMPTLRGSNGRPPEEDKYGQQTFDKFFEQFKPEIVWSTGDPWMVRHIQESKYRSEFRHIYYMPVDYDSFNKLFLDLIGKTDRIVTYTEFAQNTFKRELDMDVDYVPPGVDHNIYRPHPDARRFRDINFKLTDDDMLVGFFSRNQQRKNMAALIKAVRICSDLGYNNIYLYLHAPLGDHGPDMQGMIQEFGLVGKAFTDSTLRANGVGVTEAEMSLGMNFCDLAVLPSTREGYGMTGVETMACGTKTYVTRCTGMLDYGINFLEPAVRFRESEQIISADAHIVSAEHIAVILIEEYKNKHKLVTPDQASIEATKHLSWDSQARKWLDIIKEEKSKLFKGKKWKILQPA